MPLNRNQSDRNQLRREMRARRRLITPAARKAAMRQLAIQANRAHLLRPGHRIAVYHPYGHEADVSGITRLAWQRGCHVYAPVVTHQRRSQMHFVPFAADSPLSPNVFGIPEPGYSMRDRLPPLFIDVIFMPLVAFDLRGWRLGSGAGFYDRCLRHLRGSRLWRRPKLVGIAYEQQLTNALHPNEWDVPMDAVLTDVRILSFNSHLTRSAR